MPHALILILGDTVEATLAFDRHMPPQVSRISLVDTFRDEAEESLRVAHALGDRLWGVRLDTPSERGRVTPALAKEVRARLDQAGFSHSGAYPPLCGGGRSSQWLWNRKCHQRGATH
jgi:nicotinate phosphoribosyltransferase